MVEQAKGKEKRGGLGEVRRQEEKSVSLIPNSWIRL